MEHLEEAFEQKILQEHASVETSAEGSPLLQDVATLRQAMKDAQKRHEASGSCQAHPKNRVMTFHQHEMDQMRKRLADAEMEHAKAVNKVGLLQLYSQHHVKVLFAAQSRSHGSGTAS